MPKSCQVHGDGGRDAGRLQVSEGFRKESDWSSWLAWRAHTFLFPPRWRRPDPPRSLLLLAQSDTARRSSALLREGVSGPPGVSREDGESPLRDESFPLHPSLHSTKGAEKTRLALRTPESLAAPLFCPKMSLWGISPLFLPCFSGQHLSLPWARRGREHCAWL